MKFVNNRTFSACVKTLTFFVATALSGCYAEVGDQEDGFDEEASDEGIPGDLEDKAGDSFVQWCNQPASVGPYGTICKQQNCSGINCIVREPVAFAECREEVRRICGSPTPTFIFISNYPDHHIHYL